MVVIVLDRADDDVHVAVLHVHPCEVAGKIIVCAESLYALCEIFAHALVSRQGSCLFKKCAYLFELFLVFVTVPHCLECTVLVTADNSIKTELVRVIESFPLFHGHVLRIVLTSEWLLAITLEERLVVVKMVPCTIVYERIVLCVSFREGIDHSLVTESLLPEQSVHDLTGLTEQVDDLLVILRKCIVKRRTHLNHSIALHLLLQSRVIALTTSSHCYRSGCHKEYFSHD